MSWKLPADPKINTEASCFDILLHNTTTRNHQQQVVVVPHTLAWAVAPHKAHLVVVMGTEYYEGTRHVDADAGWLCLRACVLACLVGWLSIVF